MTSAPDIELGRLRYRAWRRGFLEADLLLGGFCDRRAGAMDARERAAFARLLEEADHDIWDWVVGGAPAPARVDAELVADLRGFRLHEAN